MAQMPITNPAQIGK